MTNGKFRPPLAVKRTRALLSGALIAAACSAHANGLGDISIKSHLGERLRVEIQLRGNNGATRGAECFHLSDALAEHSGLPHLRHAGIAVLQNPPRLQITSRDAIFEPAIELAVFYGCGVYLSRSYTVLLSPRDEWTPVAAPAAPRSEAQAPGTPDREDAGAKAAAERKVRMLLAGETPQEMAQRLYPRSEAYRKRFLRELIELNGNRISTENLDQTLPDGTTLKIPPRFVAVKKPEAATATAAGEPAVSPAPQPTQPAAPVTETKPAAAGTDRLVLSPPDEAAGAPAKATPEQAQLEMDQRLRDVIGQSRALGTELAALQRDFPNPPPEVQTRLLEMETRLARMELAAVRIKLSMAQPQTAAANPPPLAETATVPPAPAATAPAMPAAASPVAEKPAASAAAPAAAETDGFWWQLGVLLLFATALIGYLVRNSLRRGAGGALDILMPARTEANALPTASANTVPSDIGTASPKPTAGTSIGNEFEKPVASPEFEHAMPGEIEIVEVAHVLAIFGRTQAAIEVLNEFIGQNPENSLNPSLYLLKLYKQADRRDDFGALAAKLHAEFNLLEIDWDDPVEEMAPVEPGARDYREIAKELEKIPHIYSRISEQWGSRECLDYLHELLHDNRSGKRNGLPLAVTNEVLKLIAVLQRELPPESTAARKE